DRRGNEVGRQYHAHHGYEGQAGCERRPAADLLEVQTQHENQAVEGDVEEKPSQSGKREQAMAKQRERQHRLGRARLAPYEQETDHGRRREARDDEWMAPAERAALDQGASQRAERQDRRDLAGQIDLALREPRRLLPIAPRKPEAGGANRQVDQKDRAPTD